MMDISFASLSIKFGLFLEKIRHNQIKFKIFDYLPNLIVVSKSNRFLLHIFEQSDHFFKPFFSNLPKPKI